MNEFIESLIAKGMGQLMDQSRDEIMASDEIYKEDCRREEEAEQRVLGLELAEGQKSVVDEYLDCVRISNHRYADISYMAGIRDAVGLLASLGALKEVCAGERQG